MQRSTIARSTFGLAAASVATALILSLAVVIAQQPAPAAPAAPAPAPGTPTKPLVPVAASSVAADPDGYYGEFVTMTATVEATLSKTAFSVDQDKTKSTGQEVLVLAPNLQKAADLNTYVTVIGQLIKFDAADVAAKLKGYTLDLPPAAIEKYKGKPVVLATAVVNTAGIDIAKKPIPPPTTADLALAKIMTRLPQAQAAMRKGIDGSSADVVKEQATIIKTAFTEAETFWKTKGNAEATQWSADGKRHADTILVAAAAAKWDEVKAAATPLGATCGACHTKYRERMDDGTFRIKGGQ